MITDVVTLWGSVFAQCISWFETLLTRSGAVSLFLSAIFIFFVGKYLLTPLFGSSGSDKVKRRSGKDSTNG